MLGLDVSHVFKGGHEQSDAPIHGGVHVRENNTTDGRRRGDGTYCRGLVLLTSEINCQKH